MIKKWHDVNAIYQIYPRSFQDSNGDGVGDIRGIIDRFDYIKGQVDSLGVDAIWLSPVYMSPMADMGYDVSDYRDVDPLFGNLADLRELIDLAHSRGVRLMLDFVPNHTSDQHRWFQSARQSKQSKYSDYYIWHEAGTGGARPNNWESIFEGPAWTWNEQRQQYYLHSFLPEQPDLNWENPALRREMQDIVRFWLDFGVDGFRVDAVRFIAKQPGFPSDTVANVKFKNVDGEFARATGRHAEFGPELFNYLAEFASVLDEYDDRIMIFEDYPNHHYSAEKQILPYYQINPGKTFSFCFGGMFIDPTAGQFREMIVEAQAIAAQASSRPSYTMGNHDQSRIVTRYGGDLEARMVAMIQLTLPGVPVVYNGDEIGMPDGVIPADKIQDKGINGEQGGGRDPERTPMQWDDSKNAGFTSNTSEPWLPVGYSKEFRNVRREQVEPNSFLALYRRLLYLRSLYPVLRMGRLTLGEVNNDAILSYQLTFGSHDALVVINFSSAERKVALPENSQILACTQPVDYPDVVDGRLCLRPYEGVLVQIGA